MSAPPDYENDGVNFVTPTAPLTARRPPAFDDDDDVVEVLEFNNDDNDQLLLDDADNQTTTTTNVFLAELQEEVVLQCLLHKRIHEKKERVFHLEHRNGRKLLVVLPPNTQSAKSFEEEAQKTKWVATMLNTPDRVEGMLRQLAKSHPDTYVMVGRKRKLSTQAVALTTSQTIALARVCRLNDFQLKKWNLFCYKLGRFASSCQSSNNNRSISKSACIAPIKPTLEPTCMSGH